MLNLFHTGPKALATIKFTGSSPGWRDFVNAGSNVAFAQLLLWEVNESGGENILFLLMEAAFQKTPTVDAMGLIMSTFVTNGAPLQLNITNEIRGKVTTAIKLFYSQRLHGKSLMQFKQQRPPGNVFAAAREQAETDTFDIILRMSNGGGFTADDKSKTCKIHKFTLSDDLGMTRGRTQRFREIQQLAQAAQKMGLTLPSFLFNFGS